MIQDFGDSRRGALCQKGSLTIGLLCPGGGDSSRSTLVPSQSRPGIDRRPGCVARALVHVTTRYVGLHQARRFPRAQLGRLPRYGNQAGYLLTYWLIQKKKKKVTLLSPLSVTARYTGSRSYYPISPAAISTTTPWVVGFSPSLEVRIDAVAKPEPREYLFFDKSITPSGTIRHGLWDVSCMYQWPPVLPTFIDQQV